VEAGVGNMILVMINPGPTVITLQGSHDAISVPEDPCPCPLCGQPGYEERPGEGRVLTVIRHPNAGSVDEYWISIPVPKP